MGRCGAARGMRRRKALWIKGLRASRGRLTPRVVTHAEGRLLEVHTTSAGRGGGNSTLWLLALASFSGAVSWRGVSAFERVRVGAAKSAVSITLQRYCTC